MTREFFLHPVSPTEAARVPFPETLPLAEREAYMANPPEAAIADAARVPFTSAPVVDAPDEAIDPPTPAEEID